MTDIEAQTETIEIKNWQTGAVIHSAEIETSAGITHGWKLRLAVLDAVLKQVSLSGAELRGANLRGADLSWAKLRGADLRRAELRRADLSWAELRGADLSWADLSWAKLLEADLRGADLSETAIVGIHQRMDGHTYIGCDLGEDGLSIQAGCRWWKGPDALEQAREHCRTQTAEDMRAQALRIIDYLEADWKAWKQERAA